MALHETLEEFVNSLRFAKELLDRFPAIPERGSDPEIQIARDRLNRSLVDAPTRINNERDKLKKLDPKFNSSDSIDPHFVAILTYISIYGDEVT